MIKLSGIRKFTALFLLFAGISVHAQQNAVEKWSVSTKVTPAKCQSDGVVTVVSQNDDALYNFTYLLEKIRLAVLPQVYQVALPFRMFLLELTLLPLTRNLKLMQIRSSHAR